MSSLEQPNPKRSWRSLAELADTPEFRAFAEAEFPTEADPAGVSRRRWLQLMGASLALAGSAGCRWEKSELVPLVKRPVERIPGKADRYATALDLHGAAQGLLVTSVDGRPIKIEGNPAHPQSLGATTAWAQATILQLYDPDRSAHVRQREDGTAGQVSSGTPNNVAVRTWDEFGSFAGTHFQELAKDGGAGFCILAESSSSPSLAAQRARLLKAFPKVQWFEYEPLSRDAQRQGAVMALGKPYRTHFKLQQAKVILALEEDLLASHPAALEYARAFAQGRQVTDGQMNRLYAVESCPSVTGVAADHRLPLGSQDVAAWVTALEQRIAAAVPTAGQASSGTRYLEAVARDLLAHRGESVVAAGPGQPPQVHAAVHRINAALGNVGKTVVYFPEPDPARPSHREAIAALVGQLNAGRVKTLLILGGNPVYNAPADVHFASALEKAQTSIHLGLYVGETARRCTWHLPQAHFLEAWGDARSWDGSYTVQQPLIEPILGGRSALELLALLLGTEKPAGMELVRSTYQELAGTHASEEHWRKTLHDGLLADSAWAPQMPSVLGNPRVSETPAALPSSAWKNGELEIVFCRSTAVDDGRWANNGWLQETPDPITKLTWDNVATFSPATAATLGVENETLVRLKYRGQELVMPAYVLPGQAAGSVGVTLGYGRTAAGYVGGDDDQKVPPVGVDTYRLRTSLALDFDRGLTVEPTGQKYRLATTQDHHAIDLVGMRAREERLGELIREATLAEYQKDPHFAHGHEKAEEPALEQLWDEPKYEGHRWGLAIDLSKCLGCNACVVACQAENNVPIVGKERVLEGREMHWIRLDRYFSGDVENPQVSHQVIVCQQCENAPCEQVCPAAATVHSQEGLNDMVYNRCVGTRYCSNNCPYKVRRFNFFNYHKNLEKPENELLKMVYNPEVTVRSRGVMEKCTYCVQRIQATKIEAKNARRPIADGEIRTACQQVCPSQAIVFGDLADRTSEVARLQASNRAYGLLAELDTKPRTAYLAKIRNPNPDLETA